MLNEKQVNDIERQLNSLADVYYDTRNMEIKERNRGYCQGIGFLLEKIGYRIEWDDGKARVIADD